MVPNEDEKVPVCEEEFSRKKAKKS